MSNFALLRVCAACPRARACRNVAWKICRRRRWPPSTTRPNTTIGRGCRSTRRSCPLGARRGGLSRRDAQSTAAPSSACPTATRRGNPRFVPAARPAPPRRSPLFIHGGYWRSLDPSMFSHMARGLNARGVSGRGRRLRSLSDRHHRRHHRANSPRLRVPVAAAQSADVGLSAIPPAAILPPPWSPPTGLRSIPRRRPIWYPPAMRSPALSISRRSSA